MSPQGRVPGDVDPDEVMRLGLWAASHGPVQEREDMRSEAMLRVLEVLASGGTEGLGRAAWCGAVSARMQVEWQASENRWKRAVRDGYRAPVWCEVDTNGRFVPDGPARVAAGSTWRGSDELPEGFRVEDSVVDDAEYLGGVLERLLDVIEGAGGDVSRVRIALEVLCDSVAGPDFRDRVGTRRSAFDVSAESMAIASGLSAAQCCALKVLVVGERARSRSTSRTGRPIPPRPSTPGLLARVHAGDESVWRDPRVQVMVDAVVNEEGTRLFRPWSQTPEMVEMAS